MERKEFIDKITEEMKKWDHQIDKLQTKANEVDKELEAEYKREMILLNEKKENAKKRIKDLQEASGAAWDEAKIGTSRVVGDLQDTVKRIKERFNSVLNQ